MKKSDTKKSPKKSLNAADKAWITRRAKVAKLRNAGIKSWETRLINQFAREYDL